ncbi:MAG: hypothetical protein ACTSXY_05850, partial [Promethearchaeota archaeon]
MADTQRTRAQLIALFADNVTGQISAQDLRDFLVTIMNSEFVNPGDFWNLPDHQQMSADVTRGWVEYSQLISEAVSFGNILTRGASGQWVLASGIIGSAISDAPLMLGIACDSYAASTFGNVLRKGLVWISAFSASFAGNIGRPVFLKNNVAGSMTLTSQTSALIIGWVEPQQST